MLTAVTNLQIIRSLQNQMATKLGQNIKSVKRLSVGYKSGNRRVELTYLPKLGIWFSLNDYRFDSHFWNAFGVGLPKEKGSNSITVEINYSNKKKANFRTAGLWAVDNYNNYFLLHSGEIGGGRDGINKATFENQYYGALPEEVDLGKRVKSYHLITALNDRKFSQKIADFVRQVYAIKNIVDVEISDKSKENQTDYFDEFFGFKSYSINKTIVYNSNHGRIVKALKEKLTGMGHVTKKYGLIDLAVHTNGKMSYLFEIKTSLSSSNVYSAIGQLFLYSEYNNAKPVKVFVCPQKQVKQSLIGYLKKMNIKVVTYELSERKIDFHKMNLIF